MQISTTARHCEIDSDLRSFALERLEKCTRFAHDLHDARLIVTAEKFRHTAEITVRLNQHDIVSREEAPEMRVAIDRAIDALEEQLRRLKGKRLDRKREARGDTARNGANGAGALEDTGDED